jgi:heme/copper-type cytochrome/quinol oxidase subunit 1
VYGLVRRYIKTAIVFLAVGLVLGGWMLVRRELLGVPPAPYEVSAHTHAIGVGFFAEMVLGVALWLFPRPAKEDTRYSPRAAEVAYWILTLATAGRVVGELARPASSSLGLRWFVVLCGAGQGIAILIFFYNMWSRIRPLGSRAREEGGERF